MIASFYAIIQNMTKVEQKTIEKLGKQIAKLRKAKGLTQGELAEKIEVTQAYLGHIEQGIKSPSLETLEKIAKILKVHIKELFS